MSSTPPTSASRACRASTSPRAGSTPTGSASTTSTRAPAIRSSASTASRPGRTCTARCSRRYATPDSKAGAAQFPLIVPTSDEDAGAAEMRAVMDELSRWEKPALVAFSDSDPVFPYPRAGEAFCELIPGAGEQVRIEGAAHFLQEDRGEAIAEEIVRFT